MEASAYIKEIEKKNEAAMYALWDYCLGRIEEASK
jgi:hypothetical protein